METSLPKMMISLTKILARKKRRIIVIIQMIIMIILHHLLHQLLVLHHPSINPHIKMMAIHPMTILRQILLVFHHNHITILNQNLLFHLNLPLPIHLNHQQISVLLIIEIAVMMVIRTVLTLPPMKMNTETHPHSFTPKATISLLSINLLHPWKSPPPTKKRLSIIPFLNLNNLILTISLSVSSEPKITKQLLRSKFTFPAIHSLERK